MWCRGLTVNIRNNLSVYLFYLSMCPSIYLCIYLCLCLGETYILRQTLREGIATKWLEIQG